MVIVTLAAYTTAPVGSTTVPMMLPVPTVVCAKPGADRIESARISKKTKIAGVQLQLGVLPENIVRHLFGRGT